MTVDRPDPVVAKRLLVCDAIEKRTDGGVNLVNLWLLKRLPKDWHSAAPISSFAAFAWLTNGRGKVRFRLEIDALLPDGQQTTVWSSDIADVVFSDPIETRFLCIPVRNVRIGAPGDFLVELHCEDEFGNVYFLDDIKISFEA